MDSIVLTPGITSPRLSVKNQELRLPTFLAMAPDYNRMNQSLDHPTAVVTEIWSGGSLV